jgi:hypothetical protein
LQAKNDVYAQQLKEVAVARARQRELLVQLKTGKGDRIAIQKELDEATRLQKEKMVTATLFGHEAYHSEGPMIDVVGNQQGAFEKAGKEKKNLTMNEKLGSFNEQFGDALKDIAHYRVQSEENPHPFVKTAVQTSKYLDRLLKIAGEIQKEMRVEAPPQQSGLGAVNQGLLALRGDKDPEFATVEPFLEGLENLGISSPDEYIEKLTDLNVQINALVRGADQKEEKRG